MQLFENVVPVPDNNRDACEILSAMAASFLTVLDHMKACEAANNQTMAEATMHITEGITGLTLYMHSEHTKPLTGPKNITEDQARKIRFLMLRIVNHTPHDDIAAEFMNRCLNGQDFGEF